MEKSLRSQETLARAHEDSVSKMSYHFPQSQAGTAPAAQLFLRTLPETLRLKLHGINHKSTRNISGGCALQKSNNLSRC
jgi:hypothetical protein